MLLGLLFRCQWGKHEGFVKYFLRLRSNGKEKRVIFFNFRQPPNTLHIHSSDRERTWPEAHCHVCDCRAFSTMLIVTTMTHKHTYTPDNRLWSPYAYGLAGQLIVCGAPRPTAWWGNNHFLILFFNCCSESASQPSWDSLPFSKPQKPSTSRSLASLEGFSAFLKKRYFDSCSLKRLVVGRVKWQLA